MTTCDEYSIVILDNLDGRTNICISKRFFGSATTAVASSDVIDTTLAKYADVDMFAGLSKEKVPLCKYMTRVYAKYSQHNPNY